MKIVFIIDSLRRHGAQRFLTNLVMGLQSLGYVQTIIVLNDVIDPDTAGELAAGGATVVTIGRRALLFGGFGWWRIVLTLRSIQPEIVMTMLDMADTLGRPAAHLAGAGALLSSIRVRNVSKPGWQRWLDRKTIRWARKVVFNTQHVVPFACATEGVRPDQVIVITNGVMDLRTNASAGRASYRERLALPPEARLIISVGRLHPQKNHALLLHAAARLRVGQPWKLAIVGDGPERCRLELIARENGLRDRVIWLGEQTDVPGWLAAADLFVHTADFEGMPNAVMEAMSTGLPVIASAVDGTRDLIEDGRSGLLVPSGDAEAFAAAITRVMDDEELAHTLGQEAHRVITEKFTLDRMIQSYDQLFCSLVAARI